MRLARVFVVGLHNVRGINLEADLVDKRQEAGNVYGILVARAVAGPHEKRGIILPRNHDRVVGEGVDVVHRVLLDGRLDQAVLHRHFSAWHQSPRHL